MSSISFHNLTRQREATIVLIIIIALPLVAVGHAEIAYGGYEKTPSASVQVYTLSDIWYPHQGDWQPYPLLVMGNISTYYNRPIVMRPYRILVEVFIQDLTNSSSDLSWVSGADYAFLRDNGNVNTTITPNVDGDFGDNEGYVSNETEWTYWPTRGIRTVSTNLERGISYRNWDLTGYQVGDKYSICSMDFRFNPDASVSSYEWSLMFELAIIQEDAMLLEGHEFQFTITTTMTWVPLFVFNLPGGHTLSTNVTQESDLYMLEGDVEVHYDLGI